MNFPHIHLQTTIPLTFLRSSIHTTIFIGLMDGHTFHPPTNRTHPKVDLILVNMSLHNPQTLRRPDRQTQETYQAEGLVQGLATTTRPIGSTLLRPTLVVITAP